MAGGDILAAVQHGASSADFILHQQVELGLGRSLRTLLVGNARVIAEVIDESSGHFHLVCARAGIAELSADTCGRMVDKRRDGFGLRVGVARAVVVHSHVVPVVGHVEADAVVASRAMFGKLMVFHDHGHGGSDTTGERVARDMPVEGSFLAPLGSCQQDLPVAPRCAAHHQATLGQGDRLLK